jgi:membrane glycosyltransferase
VPTTALGLGVFIAVVGMSLAPKLFGLVYAFSDVCQRRAFGGAGRLVAGAAAELVFSLLLAPVMSVAHTIFILGLVARRRLQWRPQMRTGRSLGWAKAAARLWPQTVLGLIWATILAGVAPDVIPWAAPVLVGLILAVPFAVFGSRPELGRLLRRLGLCATPEEFAPPAELIAVCPWLQASMRLSPEAAAAQLEFERG